METCTICNQPVDSARFVDRNSGAHMHPLCAAGWFSSPQAAEPKVAEPAPAAERHAAPASREDLAA